MPTPSDINRVIDDPTKQLTKADTDPIGSIVAAKAKHTGPQGAQSYDVNERMKTVDPYRDEQILREALNHSVDVAKASEYLLTEDILKNANAFAAFLRGEETTDGTVAD